MDLKDLKGSISKFGKDYKYYIGALVCCVVVAIGLLIKFGPGSSSTKTSTDKAESDDTGPVRDEEIQKQHDMLKRRRRRKKQDEDMARHRKLTRKKLINPGNKKK